MPPIVLTNDVADDQFDGVIVVTDSVENLPKPLKSLQCTFKDYLKVLSDYYYSRLFYTHYHGVEWGEVNKPVGVEFNVIKVVCILVLLMINIRTKI